MAKEFTFLFFPGDVLRQIQFFNKAQKGCYLEVLTCHIENIRLSHDFLMKITRELSDIDKADFMQVFEKDDTGFFLDWVVREIKKRQEYIDSRSLNKKGKKKKKPKQQPKSYDNHMEKEKEYEIEDEIGKENGKEKSLHVKFREIFLESYKRKKGSEFAWGAQAGKHGKHLNGIIDQCRVKVGAKISEPQDQDLCEFWQVFLDHLPEWEFKNSFAPAGINSRFNEIFDKINNHKNGTNNALIDQQVAEIIKAGNPYARKAN